MGLNIVCKCAGDLLVECYTIKSVYYIVHTWKGYSLLEKEETSHLVPLCRYAVMPLLRNEKMSSPRIAAYRSRVLGLALTLLIILLMISSLEMFA